MLPARAHNDSVQSGPDSSQRLLPQDWHEAVKEPIPSRAPAETFEHLLAAIRACAVCAAHLPLGPRPIVQLDPRARLMIVGQAPGLKVHQSGIPWNDASGKRLREWLDIDETTFRDASRVAIMPMGFCYPGRGTGGDLPPRRECAPLWFERVYAHLTRIELVLLIGRYAQAWYLGPRQRESLTQTVAAFADYAPRYLPLPHPSPRNTAWFQRHPWFERELLPVLRARVATVLDPTRKESSNEQQEIHHAARHRAATSL